MELHVSEINNSQNYEQIPENMPPKMNVVKRASRVHFEDAPAQALNQQYNQTIKPSISGVKNLGHLAVSGSAATSKVKLNSLSSMSKKD